MLKQLPKSQAVLQVYAVIAFMLSAWTICAFFWRLPAWLLFLNATEIFAIFAYSMAANLLESLILLLIILVACALLPPHFLLDDFVVRGTIVSMGLIGSLMAYLGLYMQFGIENTIKLLAGPVAILLLMAFLLEFSSKLPWVRPAAMWISDRLLVFLFILLPLFVILSVYVIFRNIA